MLSEAETMSRATAEPSRTEERESFLLTPEQEALFESHRRLVVPIALKRRNRFDPIEDLVQDGLVGLADAARKFDPSLGVRFATYAKRRILGEMIDGQRRYGATIRLTRHSGKSPNAAPKSFYAEDLGKDGEGPLSDVLFVSPRDDDQAADRDAIEAAFRCLPTKMREVMRMYWLEGKTMREAGGVVGLSQTRVSQLIGQAIGRLRESTALKPYSGEDERNLMGTAIDEPTRIREYEARIQGLREAREREQGVPTEAEFGEALEGAKVEIKLPNPAIRVLEAARRLYGESGVALQSAVAREAGLSDGRVSVIVSELKAAGRWPYQSPPKGGRGNPRPKHDASRPAVETPKPVAPEPKPSPVPVLRGDSVQDVLLVIEAFERIAPGSRDRLAYWIYRRYGVEA